MVDVAATVMVCPVPPVVAVTCTGAAPPAPCPDPPCAAMLAGMYARVFGPEDATITGVFGACSGCWESSVLQKPSAVLSLGTIIWSLEYHASALLLVVRVIQWSSLLIVTNSTATFPWEELT